MHMILLYIAKHQNAIKVNNNTGIKLIKKCLIYYPIKYNWGIDSPNGIKSYSNIPYL